MNSRKESCSGLKIEKLKNVSEIRNSPHTELARRIHLCLRVESLSNRVALV